MIGAVSFIFGIKMLGNPEKAKKGNLVAAFGMGIAIFGTIFLYEHNGKPLNNYAWIFGGLIVGSVIGTMMAKKVKMTGMPQMVSFFNGMGGACAALISLVEFDHLSHEGDFTQAPALKLIISSNDLLHIDFIKLYTYNINGLFSKSLNIKSFNIYFKRVLDQSIYIDHNSIGNVISHEKKQKLKPLNSSLLCAME
jgi:NAD/NADP transhydrogenase beta subunit